MLFRSKVEKRYKVTKTTDAGRSYTFEGTLAELTKCFSYTLECGDSWSHERGRKKINTEPKTIKSLMTNVYNASNNSAANGYAGVSFDYELI